MDDAQLRVDASIAAGLIREGLNFQSQIHRDGRGSGVRVWHLQLSNPDVDGTIRVTLVGAGRLLVSATYLRVEPSGESILSEASGLLVRRVPFVRAIAEGELLRLQAEFPLDLEAESPLSASAVKAAVRSVATSALLVALEHKGRITPTAPEGIHIPSWDDPEDVPDA